MPTHAETSAKILIVEDERDLAEPILRNLRDDGYDPSYAPDGENARRLIDQQNWDLVVLDLMLPDISGESLIAYLRQRPSYPNVLVLTAKSGLHDKVSLFRLGCDDYLTKPFIYDELIERMRALLRRPPRTSETGYSYCDLKLEPDTHRLSTSESSVTLTPKETSICRMLMSPPEQLVARKDILQSVWGLKDEPSSNFIGVHIFNLRKKFAELERADWFQTVRSSGFILCDPKTCEPDLS